MNLSGPFIEATWPLTHVQPGDLLQSFGTRMVQRIRSDQGEFIIKITDQWSSAAVMRRQTAIFSFLQDHHFHPAPQLLATKTGQPAHPLANQYAAILTYHAGKTPPLTTSICHRLGQLTAQLHQLPGYPYPYLFTVADVLPEMLSLAEDQPFAAEYRQLVQNLPNFAAFPTSLIHGEIIGNTVQQANGSLCILDWDEAGIGTRILDLGHPLIQVFISEDLAFNAAGTSAFYNGYFSQGQLIPVEVDHIFDAALFYALRYLIYGNTLKRWQRIQFALEYRDNLIALIKAAIT